MKIFLIKLALFSALIGSIDYCWNTYLPDRAFPQPLIIIAVFIVVTALFHYFMLRNSKKETQVLIRYYMSGTMIRMFLYIIILVAYRVIDKPNVIPFALAFIVHYFAFTVFEISALVKQFRAKAH